MSTGGVCGPGQAVVLMLVMQFGRPDSLVASKHSSCIMKHSNMYLSPIALSCMEAVVLPPMK